jgi:hypothetical protein
MSKTKGNFKLFDATYILDNNCSILLFLKHFPIFKDFLIAILKKYSPDFLTTDFKIDQCILILATTVNFLFFGLDRSTPDETSFEAFPYFHSFPV